MLEELKLYNGNDAANRTMISGIGKNESIKKLKFYKGHLRRQTLSNLIEVIKVNKIITEFVICDVNVSPSDCLLFADMLTSNTSIKEFKIMLSRENKVDQSLALQFLKHLNNNYTLEVLTMRVTYEANNDEQFIRDVEILAENMNKVRQKHHVTTPLYTWSWWSSA